MNVDLGPLEELNPRTRATVADLVSPILRYQRGERIAKQGDRADGMYVVQSGYAGVEVSDRRTGHSYLVTVLREGSAFGELALLDAGQRRTASVLALEETSVVHLPSDALEALRKKHAELDRLLLGILTEYVVRLTDQLTMQRLADPSTKVRSALCDLHLTFGRGEIGLTQGQIADVAGVSRARVNALLGELEREGLVTRQAGCVTVADYVALLRSVDRL